MDILVTCNRGYLLQLSRMLFSLSAAHPGENLRVFLAYEEIPREHLEQLEELLKACAPRIRLERLAVDGNLFAGAPVTQRYPKEMYFRILAAFLLPGLQRVLYLDPDIVVLHSLKELYELDLGGDLLAACTHIRAPLKHLNEARLGVRIPGPYINSGVMLMNLELLRQRQQPREIFQYIQRHTRQLMLPDQDVLSGLYSQAIRCVDPIVYNLSERIYRLERLRHPQRRLDRDWVAQNTAILHYCGRNKPWCGHYFGERDSFYWENVRRMRDCLGTREELPE